MSRPPGSNDPNEQVAGAKSSEEIREQTTKRAYEEAVSGPSSGDVDTPQQVEDAGGFGLGDVREIYKEAPKRTRAVGGNPIDPGRQGLCFSGGGIRSASFSLGVLQGLRASGEHSTRDDKSNRVTRTHKNEFSKSEFLSAVSGGGYTAGAFDMIRSHGVFNPEGPGLIPLAPGSLEEKHIRLHSSFVAHTFGEKVNLAMSLVVGIALNLFVVGLALFLLLRPFGWFLHALEPDLISGVSNESTDATGIGVALIPAVSFAWALAGLLVVAAFLHYLASAIRDRNWSEVLSSASHGALGLAALTLFLLVVIPVSIWLFYVAVPWLQDNIVAVSDFFDDGPGGDLLGLFVAGGSLAFIAVAAKKQLASIKVTWWVRIAAFVIVPLILAWVVAVTVFGAVSVGAGGTHWLLPEYAWWLAFLVVYCAMYLLVDPGRWSLNRFYRRRLEQAFAVQRRRSDIKGDAHSSIVTNPYAESVTSESSDVVSAAEVSQAIRKDLKEPLREVLIPPEPEGHIRDWPWPSASALALATIPHQIAILLVDYPPFAVRWVLAEATKQRPLESSHFYGELFDRWRSWFSEDPAARINHNLCLVLGLLPLQDADLASAVDAIRVGIAEAVGVEPLELAPNLEDLAASSDAGRDSPALFDEGRVAEVGSRIHDALTEYFETVIPENTSGSRVNQILELLNPEDLVAGLNYQAQKRAYLDYGPWDTDLISDAFFNSKELMGKAESSLQVEIENLFSAENLLVSALYRAAAVEPTVFTNPEVSVRILQQIEVTVNRVTASRGYVEPIPCPETIQFANPRQKPQFISSAAVNVSDAYATEPGLAAMSFTFDTTSVGSPPSTGIGTAATKDYWKALDGRKRQADMSVPSVVAMSGAAISPGMGKRANKWLGAFMAVANARLSRWIPNPNWVNELTDEQGEFKGEQGEWDDWPRITYIFKEIAGWYSTEDRYVNITDGGFYDNMGLFELLNRGCGMIYAVDGSGAEPGVFSTIGQSMALASSELGIQFSINLDSLRGDDKTTAESYDEKRLKLPWRKRAAEARGGVLMDKPYVWGEYWSEHDDQKKGRICYIQTAVTKDAPWPVRSYWEAESKFPNHSTADQSFSYDEFEAYRELGYWAALEAKTNQDASVSPEHAGESPRSHEAVGPTSPPVVDEQRTNPLTDPLRHLRDRLVTWYG